MSRLQANGSDATPRGEETSARSAPMPETLLGYKVQRLLGHGAVSTVYAVRRADTNQDFALKHLVCDSKRADRHLDEFAVEVDVGRKVAHPQIRRVLESQVKRNWLRKPVEAMLLMELVEGARLDQIQMPDPPMLVDWFIQLAQALGAMHKQHWVHCAVKPSNLLITRDLTLKLIDLGQACTFGTKRDRALGSPEFLAPEQVVHAELVPHTDVYGLGATLYRALTGRPLPGLMTIERGGKQALVEPKITPPMELNPMAPEILANLAMECVRTNPTKRPADMAELTRRLETIRYALTHRKQQASNGGSHATPAAPATAAAAPAPAPPAKSPPGPPPQAQSSAAPNKPTKQISLATEAPVEADPKA